MELCARMVISLHADSELVLCVFLFKDTLFNTLMYCQFSHIEFLATVLSPRSE